MSSVHRLPIAGVAVLAVAASLAICPPAAAQETRAEVIAQERAKKATELKPYVPSTAERLVTRVSTGFLALPGGFYPAVGSVYSGGGFSIGPGYRYYYGDRALVQTRGMYSIRNYKLVELSTFAPGLAGDRLTLRGEVGWRDATQVGYFGVGMQTSADDRANFRTKQTYASGGAEIRPGGPLFLNGAVGYEDFNMLEGRGSRPPVEELYTPATAPGLGLSPTYTRLSASAGIDWRPHAGYARRGGVYSVGYESYIDRDDVLSFDRVDAEVVQHLPLLQENVIISLRGRIQSTLDDSDQVPYFLMPQLGSGSTLRAFSTGRFRDRHALLLQAEWRWIANREGLDVALFYDMGKVASRRADLDLEGMKSNFGIGFRFHGPQTTPLRIELAHGNEGFNLVFAVNAAF